MKILYVIDRPNLYGSEIHTLEIIQYFRKQHDVFLLSLWEGPLLNKVETLGVRTKVIKMGWRDVILRRGIIKKFVRKYQPDIIHAHQPKAVFTMSLIGWILKIPTVITVHSKPVDNAMLHSGIMYYIVYLFHWLINFKAQVFAKKMVFVSNDMKKRAHFKAKSAMIYNWLSPRFEYPDRLAQRGFEPKKEVGIVSVGSVTKGKGYELLIDFLSMLKEEISFRAIVLGDGDPEYIRDLEEKASEKGIEEKIKFVGYKSNIGDYLLKADIFVLFSESESFGMSYVEAMAYGLPVVAKNLPVLREIIPEGNCLSDDLEECKSQLLNILNDHSKYLKILETNRKWVDEQFSYQENMGKLAKIYQSVLK